MMRSSARTLRRAFAYVLSGAVLLAVASPIVQNWRDEPQDDFPLSYYPMFSKERGETTSVTYIVGVDAAGRRRPIPSHYAFSGGMNQARKQLRRVRHDKRRVDALCRLVAARIAGSGLPENAGIERVYIATVEIHLDDFFRGRREPKKETVHAICRVGPRPR